MTQIIKIGADVSDFNAEFDKLQAKQVVVSEKLKAESKKVQASFKETQKEIEKTTKALGQWQSVLKNQPQTEAGRDNYAQNVSLAQKDMQSAHSLVSQMAGKLSAMQAARDAEATRARHERWAGNASKFAGFAGGAMMGGGGGYSQFGAGIGSMIPGPLGLLGGAVGGIAGGAMDKFIGSARQEAKTYSELRRMIGSTTNDFGNLRDSVRSVIHGFGVTDNEAANLAKQFAHTAGLTGDATNTITSAIGTSTGFAQGYGINGEQATSFFANMRLSGGTKNDADNRRLALLIGESVAKGGTSAKMDEVMASISNFASHFAQSTLTNPNAPQFASYLSSLTGSGYAGLRGNPNNAAGLLGMADASVNSGGTKGDASQYHWFMARQEMFRGMSWSDNSIMAGAGLIGDLSAQFAPGSPVYDQANAEGKARMDNTRAAIERSGLRNNFQAGMAHVKAISGGNSALENENFRGMFGGNPQQAAALMGLLSKDPGLGGLEKQLSGYGIGIKNLNVSQIASMSELLHGGDAAMAKQYEKLAGSGKLRGAEKIRMDEIVSKEGYSDLFKKELLKLTGKYDIDDGQKSETTQIDISNKIQEGVGKLVGIETDAREYLLRILNTFGGATPVMERMINGFMEGNPDNGMAMDGKPLEGRNQSLMMGDVKRKLGNIAMAGSQEAKDAAYIDVMREVNQHPESYPQKMGEWAKKARGGHEVANTKPAQSQDVSEPTIPATVPPASGDNMGPTSKKLVDLVKSPTRYDELFSKYGTMNGVDPLALKVIAARESGFNPNAMHVNSNGTTDYGLMQHNGKFMGERGVTSENWRDPAVSIAGAAKFMRQNLDRAGGDYQKAFGFYNGSGDMAKLYATESMAVMEAARADQLPASYLRQEQRKAAAASSMAFKHQHQIQLFDRDKNPIAEPYTSMSTSFGPPVPTGM